MLFKKRNSEDQCSCPFSGTSPRSCQGEHPLFFLLINTEQGAGSSPSARQRNSAVRALSMAWAGFTQVFLTPVDMTKLKMMENCQLKTPFQTVCLITVGFCPMVLSWCGPVTPGMPKGTERMKELLLDKPCAVVLAALHHSRIKMTTFLLLFYFILFCGSDCICWETTEPPDEPS